MNLRCLHVTGAVGGRSVWNLRYADDTTLIVRSCNELQQQVSAIENISAQFGLTINATKTHIMVIDAESDADRVITIYCWQGDWSC